MLCCENARFAPRFALMLGDRDMTYYAACEDGHEFWSGPDRDTYVAAEEDAHAHDNEKHGGHQHAGVLNNV